MASSMLFIKPMCKREMKGDILAGAEKRRRANEGHYKLPPNFAFLRSYETPVWSYIWGISALLVNAKITNSRAALGPVSRALKQKPRDSANSTKQFRLRDEGGQG